MLLDTTDERFAQDVLRADEGTVVDFWAPWCGHCRRLEPLLEKLADGGQRVVRANVDLCPLTARQFGVGSIPALYYFKDGQPGPALVGPGSAGDIDAWLAAQRA